MRWELDRDLTTLKLGTLERAVCFVVKGTNGFMLTGWSLPGINPPEDFFDSLGAAQNRAEQLLDLWLLKAGLGRH